MKLTTHLNLVLGLRNSEAIPLIPPIHLHCLGREKFTFTWLSVFMSEPLHAPSINILLYKGFDNKNVQLNYISHTKRTYGKIT